MQNLTTFLNNFIINNKKTDKMSKYSLGSWITSDSLPIVEVMAESGFDWLCIDLEHTMIDYEGVQK